MSRWLPVIAAACLLGVGAVAAVVAVAPRVPATSADRAAALASELRCPDCQGLSVADSPTSSAVEIRRQIDELVASGASDDEVRAHFVARYGEWIRLAPGDAIVWVVPFAALAFGVGLLVLWIRSRPAPPAQTIAVSDEERRRLRDEAEVLDA
jgi:cytochrome c-type biogenesis protein CcmH